ncbi:MAG: hypothetical protein IT236_06515 [Bacteroidia bacterium]|nr:hypothetical protein [Bacteroidia bacterium]
MAKKQASKKKSGTELTEKEIKVIKLTCADKSNDEIALALKKSRSWVDWVKGSIYKKIKQKTPVGMAMYAVKHGIVKID